jgi:hypothetical protein
MHAHDTSDLLRRLLGAPSRNHFFYGKRMDVQHFQLEQDYGKHKQWMLNKLTLGKGVLCGLKVTQEGDRLCVEPGVAIDGLGREIVVPVRACIDPARPHEGCCGEPAVTPAPVPVPPPVPAPTDGNIAGVDLNSDTRMRVPAPDGGRDEDGKGIFTLWLCYRECFTDQQPVLVTDCDTRSHCAPGTVVESFCLKVTPGLPPLQRDPDWCLNWAAGGKPPKDGDLHAIRERLELGQGMGEKKAGGRREALCELLDDACGEGEGEVCVPLAAGMLRDGRIVRLETCAVRPRVYSNAVLLDLILCLAERVDACCNGHEPPPPPKPQEPKALLRVASVAFVSRNADGVETLAAEVESPLKEVKLKIKQHVNLIRVTFTEDISRIAPHQPSTHTYGDNDPDRHNVQVRPSEVNGGFEYVPGKLTIEGPRAVRFDLFEDSPYARHDAGGMGWQKGEYTLLLFGDGDAAAQRHPIADTAGTALDGEPAAPVGGAISGDGTPGGTFKLVFIIS